MFNVISQQAYPKVFLGSTPYSIAKYGCLLCSITEYYNWIFVKNVTPEVLEKKLSFNAQGEFEWSSLANIGLRLVAEVKYRDDATIQRTLADPVQGCILAVHNFGHWMLALSKAKKSGVYNVADSWTGKKSDTSAYLNNISGCAIITKI